MTVPADIADIRERYEDLTGFDTSDFDDFAFWEYLCSEQVDAELYHACQPNTIQRLINTANAIELDQMLLVDVTALTREEYIAHLRREDIGRELPAYKMSELERGK